MPKTSHKGHLLVAHPNNPRDELSRAVILVIAHTYSRSMGIQINNPLANPNLQSICENIGIEFPYESPLYLGGNVANNKIHVIHTSDWNSTSTIMLNKDIYITSDISVLAALSRGEGPSQYRACAGFWAWDDGELDRQLNHKFADRNQYNWELIKASDQNVFDDEGPAQWRKVLEECASTKIDKWFSPSLG